MLLILVPIIVFLFLLVGATAFVACGLFPRSRRVALSVALWFAALGPCVLGWMAITGWAFIIGAFVADQSDEPALKIPNLQTLEKMAGYGWLIVGVCGTILLATLAAWVHQVIVRRMTFPLFRLYAAAVLAGIGSVWGWALGWWVAGHIDFLGYRWGLTLWLVGMLLLIIGFGYAGYRWARQLRGHAPKRFSWVTPEEFEGI